MLKERFCFNTILTPEQLVIASETLKTSEARLNNNLGNDEDYLQVKYLLEEVLNINLGLDRVTSFIKNLKELVRKNNGLISK